MTQEFKQELFNICSQSRLTYTYISAYVKIEENDTHDAFYITEVEWAETKLGLMDYDDVKNELLELTPVDIEVSGYYHLKGLFPLGYDYDDYTSWTYIMGPEIIEYEFQMTLEQAEKYNQEFKDLGDVTDLFN